MTKKLIHINRNVIQWNAKHGANIPVCRVSEGKETKYGRTVDIHGPSKMIYDPDNPLKCGAKLWIETEADITIEDECRWDDIKLMKQEHKEKLL